MKRDQSGIGVAIIIIIVFVLAAIAGAAYFVFNRESNTVKNSATSVVSKAENQKALEQCKKEYNDDDLCKALSNFMGSKQYQTTMTSAGGGSNYSYIEVDGDKTYTKYTVNGKSVETIAVGDTRYTKDNSDNKWWKQVFKSDSKTDMTDDLKFDTNFDNSTVKTTYAKIGQEACDKLTCVKYKVTESNSKDIQYIWIDTKDHLIRKWSIESADGSKMESSYTYNKKSIDIPKDTKEASPTQNVIPTDINSAMMNSQSSNSNNQSSETNNMDNNWSNSDSNNQSASDNTTDTTTE